MTSLAVHIIRWALRLFYYRVQLLTALLLVGLTVIAGNEELGGNMVRGIFDIDTAASLYLAGLLSILLTFGMRLSARLVRLYGPERFDFANKGLIPPGSSGSVPNTLRDAGWLLIGMVPLITIAAYRSSESGFWTNGKDQQGITGLGAIALMLLGCFTGTLLHVTAVIVSGVLFQSPAVANSVMPLGVIPKKLARIIQKLAKTQATPVQTHPVAPRGLNRLISRIPKAMHPGIYDASTHQTLPGHVVLAAFTMFSMLLLAIIGLMPPAHVAPLVSLLSLMLAGCLVLSGIAFFFDRLPIPVFLIVAVWVLGVSYIWRKPHTIERHTVAGYTHVPGSDVLAVNPDDPNDGFPIVIAAEGGGIHAGLWTAHVLEQLIAEDPCFVLKDRKGQPILDEKGRPLHPGKEFLSRVRCVSGVSGGSYGLMYFVHAMANGEYDTTSRRLSRAAGQSSLGAVVHGLIFKDVLSGVLPFARGKDRGQAMEEAWEEFSPGLKGLLLSDWTASVRKRDCPAVLFNATSVERGTPLVFGNTTFEDDSKGVQNWLYEAGGGYSVPVVSAARASATFPFVTPAALVQNGGRKEHAVDGGYYDNYGIAVLSRWLHAALDKLILEGNPARRAPQQVLVIQIRSASPSPAEANFWDQDSQVVPSLLPEPMSDGLFTELAAPLKALLSVRVAGQKQHNEDDFQRMTELLSYPDRHIKSTKLKQPSWLFSMFKRGKQKSTAITIKSAVFAFRDRPPLSWHLTEAEKRNVTSKELAKYHPQNLNAVREYLQEAVWAAEDARAKTK
jgi:predicted acylesterase/phospholipase RssA